MPISNETLTHIIRHHWPQCDDEPLVEPIRTGKFNESFFVQMTDLEVVVRIAPPDDAVFVFYERRMMRQEPQIHALVAAETAVPIPRILAFDKSHKLLDRDYMIMERLPGRPWTEMHRVNADHVLHQVGEMLAQVHNLRATAYGYLGAHKPMRPQTNWVDAFAIMWDKLVADIVGVGHYNFEEADFMRKLLNGYLSLFDRPLEPSLLHMDIWHQNILVGDAGAVTGLVDWDRALWGDPEIEFAVLDYCGISKPAFWQGYGRARDDSPEAHIRQVFYLLYELQKYIVIRHGRRHDPQAANQYKQQVFQIIKQVLV